MFFKKKNNCDKLVNRRDLLREKLSKLGNSDLLFIRHEVFKILKKRGVLSCSK